MGKLTLKFDIAENSSYNVGIESKTYVESENAFERKYEKTVDITRKIVSFDVEDGETNVYIEQCFEPEGEGALITALKLITLPIRGILNTVLMNNDTEWEKDICAYGLKALLNIHVSGNMEYEIKIKNSEFSEDTESFSFPTVETSPSVLKKTEKTDNRESIDKCFRKFVWRMYSFLSVIVILFGVILFSTFIKENNNMVLIVSCGIVAVVLFVSMILINAKNERKRKYLHHLFDKNNHIY